MMIAVQLGILLALLVFAYLLIQKQKKERYKQVFPVVSTDILSIQDRIFIDQQLHQKIMVLKEIYADLCNKYNRGINPLHQEAPCDLEERLELLKSNMEFIQSIKGKIMKRCSLSPSELTVLNYLINENDNPYDYRPL